MCTFLTELDTERRAGHWFALATLYEESNAEHRDARHVAGTRQCHTELLRILRHPSASFDRNAGRLQDGLVLRNQPVKVVVVLFGA